MIVAFSVSPSGGDDSGSVSAAVAEAVRVVRASGLPNETSAMFTNVDAVACAASQLGLKADIRPGHAGQLTAKVRRIEEALGE